MYRRAFARHRTGAALLLGLFLRAPSASAEPAKPDETRVGTVEGKTAEELASATETPPIPAAPMVAPRMIRDEGVADAQRASTPADGSFALRALPGGTATVRVESSRHLAQQTNVGNFLDRLRVPYLDRIGVSAQTRGPELALSGEANSSLFDVGGPLETLFARGRGSLLPALLSLFSPEVKLDDRDFQTRATYEPSARDRFSAFGFGSYDLLGEKRNGILTRLGDACRPRITFTW